MPERPWRRETRLLWLRIGAGAIIGALRFYEAKMLLTRRYVRHGAMAGYWQV